MKSLVTEETIVKLILNQSEAEWLKTVVQNPLSGDIESESAKDFDMRKVFWHALPDFKK